jgi:hypothetical protein
MLRQEHNEPWTLDLEKSRITVFQPVPDSILTMLLVRIPIRHNISSIDGACLPFFSS